MMTYAIVGETPEGGEAAGYHGLEEREIAPMWREIMRFSSMAGNVVRSNGTYDATIFRDGHPIRHYFVERE